MTFSKTFYKTVLVFFTIAILLFFAYQQYRTYAQSTNTIRQQVSLRGLRSRLIFLDESLTMSARLYVLTNDEKWRRHYNNQAAQFTQTLKEIGMLYPGTYNGKDEMQKAGVHLFYLESLAFEKMQGKQSALAKSILFNQDYDQNKKLLETGTGKLTLQIDSTLSQMMRNHGTIARKNAYIVVLVVLLILVGWYAFVRLVQQSQKKINALNLRRAEEAIAAEKALQKTNAQLHLLSMHLQEVREKERQALAYEITEQLGQQLAAIKVKTDVLQAETSGQQATAQSMEQVSQSLGKSLNFLRNLADEVYPGMLKDLGLVEAMDWETNHVAANAQAEISFFSEVEEIDLDAQTATVLFRTYQEKMRNLLINGSNRITSSLRIEDNHLMLCICDECHQAARKKLIEDLAIEERLRSIKAKLQLSQTGEESCFTVLVPYPGQAA